IRNQTKTSSLIIVPFSQIQSKNTSNDILDTIWTQIQSKLSSIHLANDSSQQLVQSLQRNDGAVGSALSLAETWSLARSWITARQVIPQTVPQLQRVLTALQTAAIVGADVSRTGTQLKLLLELEGGERALFKPQRYSRDHVIPGMDANKPTLAQQFSCLGVYSGFDRHNGEIIAFHLARLLDFRVVPIVVARRLDVAQLKAIASAALSATFSPNGTCFYGECHYCSPFATVCADSDGRVEGSLHLLLPSKYKLQRVRNPWQRTYRAGVRATWETQSDYCFAVAQRLPLRPRLLDIVDASVFDFLISNADRHHFEAFKDVPNSALLLIDNGKSFGDPDARELSILAPLYQCCVMRNASFARLRQLHALPVSSALHALLASEPSWPLLTPRHLAAIDTRVHILLALLEVCFETKGKQNVLK
ncbi:unnamed protein product, partial [Medioppia subpectinata]